MPCRLQATFDRRQILNMKSFLFSGCCWCSSNQLRAPSAPGRATKYQLFETKSFSIPQLLRRRRGFKRSRDYVRDSGTSTRAANIILGQGLIINLVCHILPLATHCHTLPPPQIKVSASFPHGRIHIQS